MAKNNNLQDLLRSVADAIRSRKGTTDLINAQDFDSEILSIPGGGLGDNTKEVVKAISGVESDNDVTLANAIAKAYDDTPTEQVWSGTRTTANGATIKDGVASVHSIKGRSLVVSQLANVDNGDQEVSGLSFTKAEGGKCFIINGTATSNGNKRCKIFNAISGHKYLHKGCPANGSDSTYYVLVDTLGIDYGNGNVRTATSEGGMAIRLYFKEGVTFNNVKWYPQVFDLTAMGMADVTSANDFAQRLGYATIEDVPYIPYGTSIVSSMPREIVSRGRNLWDEEWEVGQISSITGLPYASSNAIRSKNFIPITPGKTYYHKTSSTATSNFFEYDANKVFIKPTTLPINRWFSVSENCRFIKVVESTTYGTIYKNDICINVSDSLNGTYSPYMPPSTLPITLPSVFADGIKSAPTATDELTPTKATARVGVVDLGSLVWAKNFFSAYNVIYARFNYAYPGDVVKQCFLSDKYTDSGQYSISSMNNNNIIGLGHRFESSSNTTQVVIRDTQYATADEFVASLQGSLLIYPLENPIETTLDETKAFYQVQNGGTEEIVKDNVAPFVADIAYREPSATELVNGLSNAINE